jgi:hypothetical protein
MRRRLIYLQHILKQKETSLVKQFLKTQFIAPKKKDWAKTIIENLQHLQLEYSLEEIENMPKQTYIKLIKRKITEFSFKYLLEKRNRRNGKGIEMQYKKLEMQSYLETEDMDISNEERKFIFQLRKKMCFKVKTHFSHMYENTICDGCQVEESRTSHILECTSLIGPNEIVTYLPDYRDLYGEDEDEIVYVSRIVKDNMRRLPVGV